MKFDGQLERAQLELISGATTTPAVLGRIYADITNTANAIPRMYDGTQWCALLKRNINYSNSTTTATIGADIEMHRMDASGAAYTATLPAVASMAGKTIVIQKTDTTFNAATVKGSGAELIDGANTLILSTYLEWVRLLCVGATWTVIATGYYGGKTAFTPTGSWSTNTTYTGYWWRVGNRLNFEAHLALAGAPTSATLTVNLPTGTTVDTAQMLRTTSGQVPFGPANFFDTSATANYQLVTCYGSSSVVTMKYDSGLGTLLAFTQAAPVTVANGDEVDIAAYNIPITNWRG